MRALAMLQRQGARAPERLATPAARRMTNQGFFSWKSRTGIEILAGSREVARYHVPLAPARTGLEGTAVGPWVGSA